MTRTRISLPKAAAFAAIGALALSACSTYGEGRQGLGYGTRLAANLSGPAEVGPGDADGTGVFEASLDPGGELCYELDVDAVAAPTGAHIHRGPAGENGPVAVPLTAPAGGEPSAGCTAIDGELAREILEDPDGFYVNVHNEQFPGGAVRGQIMAAGM